jgi:hypothetical protein
MLLHDRDVWNRQYTQVGATLQIDIGSYSSRSFGDLRTIIRTRHRFNRNRNKFINQIRAPGGNIQITIMIDTQQYIKINIRGEISIICL